MNILQFGETDIVGKRFNGQDLHKEFIRRGFDSHHMVWRKDGNDENTYSLGQAIPFGRCINSVIRATESILSLQSLLYPFSWTIPQFKAFRLADIVHYHIIHNNYFSLAALPFLTRQKPSVWTLHDPWAMTGHCIYPFDCEKWKTGCNKCPALDIHMPLRRDRSAFLWRCKETYYGASDIDIVVASRWMLNMVRNSPLMSKFRVHLVPFGVNLEFFRPQDTEEAKKELGVRPGSLVLSFRAVNNDYKGLPYIQECLRKLKVKQPICLLTTNTPGIMKEFEGKYQIIDLGWINDERLTVNAYNATDIFLMPSIVEAFGMMAIEAMACGKPVIVFEGNNALQDTVFASQGGGIAVPCRDAEALRTAIERLINSPNERLAIGGKALELAREHYDFKVHADRMLKLYREVIDKRAPKTKELI
jgi:glycosyltransferase involved in cell wall biosynthesis